MRRKLVILFFFLTLFLFGKAQEFDPFFEDKMARQESKRFQLKSDFTESPGYTCYDLVYQRMEWKIDPNVWYIDGKITSYFVSECDVLNEVEFDLHEELTVDSVVRNGQKMNFVKTANKIFIQLNSVLQAQEIDSFTVYYQGKPANAGFGSFAKDTHQGVPVIWTLSEPFGAMEWWPCKQTLADKIDSIDIIVTSPEAYRTASNGILVSETVTGESRTMHWKHRFPIATYLVAIAVTNYAGYSDYLKLDDGRKIEILNYVYPENLAEAKTKTAATIDIMEVYNNLIGEYPFAREKYGHAQFGWGGGMEHQTMSFMNNFGFHLISHELAHQWFGDYITLGSWHDIWLNEGFATYLTGLAYEHLLDGVYWPLWKKSTVETITRENGGSVFVEDTTSVSRIFNNRLSYSKGAYLLHMLRWIMGDENFFEGVRSYYNDPEVANGFARTHQFVQHMESAGDTSLTGFFNDWFYGEGFPVYSAGFVQVDSEKLRIRLSQTSSHNSVGFFEMPVPVRVYNAGKTDSADFRLINTVNDQEFLVEPGFVISELKIDPDYWLVSKTATIVSVPEETNAEKMKIYPNPFSGKVTVYIPGDHKIISAGLFSAEGTIVQPMENNKTIFDLSGLVPGIYVIRIKTSADIYTQKIIKQ
jgi:aminopeptidase N